MTDFWPPDITADDVRSPGEILAQVVAQFDTRMKGQLFAGVLPVTADDRTILRFYIQNPARRNMRFIFDITYQAGSPYPLVIEPPTSTTPDYLKRKRYVPSLGDIVRMPTSEGRWVENSWVCSTPGEFEEKLHTLLALDRVKVIIFSALTADEIVAQAATGDATEEQRSETAERSEPDLGENASQDTGARTE